MNPESPAKPDLVIHAGFPKCATTALQQIMFRDDAALTQAIGHIWIGRGIIPNGPGAPVSEMMYDPDATRERIARLPLDPTGRYFLSSEALAHRPDMIEVLARRFTISQIVLTTRLPCLMALSDYCFGGWLTHAPAQAGLLGRTDALAKTCDRLRRFAPVSLCPIEPENLGSRFLGTFSDVVPEDVDHQVAELGAANPSAPPALAAALYNVLQEKLTAPVPGPLRSAFTRMAMINRGPPGFANAMPADLYATLRDKSRLMAEVEAYDTLLAQYEVPPELRASAITACTEKLDALRQKPLVDAELKAAMRNHAEWFVKRIQKDSPETAALFSNP